MMSVDDDGGVDAKDFLVRGRNLRRSVPASRITKASGDG